MSQPTLRSSATTSIQIPSYWLWLLLIIGFAILLKARFIGIAFERDEGAYAYYGRLILQGGIPYIDFQGMKFPGLFYTYSFIQWFTGDTADGLQIGFVAWHILSVVFFFDIVRRLFNPNTALVAALAYVLWSINRDMSGFTAQSEHLLSGFMVFAGWCAIKATGERAWVWLLAAGVLAAMAFQMKQTAALLVAFLGLFIVLRHWIAAERNIGHGVRDGALFAAGFVALLGASILLMVAQGSFDEFRYWVYEYPASYISSVATESGWNNLRYNARNVLGFSVPLSLLAGIGLFRPILLREGLKPAVALWGFLAFSFLSVVPGFRFMGHYWLQMVPVLALLTALGAEVGATQFARIKIPAKTSLACIAILATVVTLALQWPYFFTSSHTEILRQKYTFNPFPEMKVVADYVKRNSGPDDQVVVFGAEPQLYYYSNRHCPSQYKYFEHLVKGTEASFNMQRQFIREIEESMPLYTIYLQHSVSWNASSGAADSLVAWANVFFNEHYITEGKVDILPVTHYEFANPNAYKPRSSLVIYILRRKPELSQGLSHLSQ